MENVWTYLAIGFLGIIIVIQWFTNKAALEERNWYRQKTLEFMPGDPIRKDTQLDIMFIRRKRR